MTLTGQEQASLRGLRRALEEAYDRKDMAEVMRLSRLIDRMTVTGKAVQ